jgi:hypothetical protein
MSEDIEPDHSKNSIEWALSSLSKPGGEQPVLPKLPLRFIFDGEKGQAPPGMLVKRLIPAEGVCFIGGQSGAGKTFVAVHLATCLASGTPFLGFPLKERVGCVILAAEGAGGLKNRFDAAKKALDIDRGLPIAWIGVTENLLDPASLRQMTAALMAVDQAFKDEHGVRLGAIFVDTLAAAFGFEDENDAAKVNAALRCLRKVGSDINALVIPVHHYGKAASTGLRGSSAFKGGADVVISVLVERDEITGKSGSRSICLAKAREGEEGPISSFELQWVHLGFDDDNEPYGSCVVGQIEGAQVTKAAKAKHSPAAKIALAALHEAIDGRGNHPRADSVHPREHEGCQAR